MHEPLFPSLSQINTLVWLTELSRKLGRPATLDDRTDDANFAGQQSQCYVRLPFPYLAGRMVRLKDLMGPASYDRDGNDLLSRGLYLYLPAWGYHVFEMSMLP